MKIANAVSYLHVGFGRPIIFRDINPSHILFSKENVAKLFDFSLSESIPEGETHVKDKLEGSFGFTGPEHSTSSTCNEKCDVYSFGVVILDLLTGQRANNCPHDGHLLQDYVRKHIENDTFHEITDPMIIDDCRSFPGKVQQLQGYIQLTFECVKKSLEDRSSITKKLRKMYLSVV